MKPTEPKKISMEDLTEIKEKVKKTLMAMEEEYWHILYDKMDDTDASLKAKEIIRANIIEIEKVFGNYG